MALETTTATTIDESVKELGVGVHSLSVDQPESFQFNKSIRKVAVIGAGPAGLPSAKELLDEGIEVKIYERNAVPGGLWNYSEEKPLIPVFPSEIPTKIVSPSFPPKDTKAPYTNEHKVENVKEELLKLAPPTTCYRSLRNNVPTPMTKYKTLEWPKDTPWFTSHDKILEYLQTYSSHFKLDQITEYNTSVEKLKELPNGEGWKVLTKHAEYKDNGYVDISWKEETFDAVVVATGHFHTPYVPNISGLSDWQNKWSESILHSKQYRIPEEFKDKTVLLVGNGASALDLARDISTEAKTVYQSVRESGDKFDERFIKLRQELRKFYPESVQRVDGVKNFHNIKSDKIQDAVIELQDGSEISGVDYVIFCTGYVFSYHFLQDLHSDEHINTQRGTSVDDDHVLVKDGFQVFNLHKDIFYIPNPTLSFVGVPYHVATFPFFEFQACAVSRVYSNSAKLPTEKAMREEWQERLKEKGAGREFHAFGGPKEIIYLRDLINWLNEDGKHLGKKILEEHDEAWIDVRDRMFAELKKDRGVKD